jgi:hypothetical protein
LESFFAALGRHEIVKSAQGGLAAVVAVADPMHGHADDGPSYDGQVHDGVGFSNSAAVLARDDIEPEMQAGFNAPVSAVGLKHLLGVHFNGRARAQQILRFDLFSGLARAIRATGQSSGLLGVRKSNRSGGRIEGNEATRFDAATVAFTALSDGPVVPRGKMRPTDGYRALARCQRHPADWL